MINKINRKFRRRWKSGWGGCQRVEIEKEKSRIRAVQMDNLRGLLGIGRMDSLKCKDKGVCVVKKGVDEWIDKSGSAM